MTDAMTTLFLELRVLTAVHVGSGEEYVPTDYVIRGNTLYGIHRERFVEHLERNDLYGKFLEICAIPDEKGILAVRRFVWSHFTPAAARFGLHVSDDVRERFTAGFGRRVGPGVYNRLRILRHVCSAYTGNPFVPGSSVKGSLRTAVLDRIAREPGMQAPRCVRGKRLDERMMLGMESRGTSDDPFRRLKVSDFLPVSDTARVEYVHNTGGRRRGVSVAMEILTAGTVCVGSIPFAGRAPRVGFDSLREACALHYGGAYEFEKNFFRLSVPAVEEALKDEACLVMKVGKHSGAFALTLEGYRKGRIRNRRRKRAMDHPTTTWVAESGKPMGWVALRPVPEERYGELLHAARALSRVTDPGREEEDAGREETAAAAGGGGEEHALPREEEPISDYNTLCTFAASETADRESRRRAVLRYFTETEDGRKKLKALHKRMKKGEEPKAVKIFRDLCPELFTDKE